ncbi:MAG: hypothetical protein HYW24_02795 [Candidatus Aenigmarchaeota archaeon]|nr:hypothetical protein [Candidatus Aenigmarchaeota archaeon]
MREAGKMEKDRFMLQNRTNIMSQDNIFSKIENFDKIVTDRNSMTIFLTVAKKKLVYIEELEQDTKLSLKDIVISLDKLEQGDFVKRNPNPSSHKYILGFNGQLFAEQLRNSYPEVKNLLGNEKIIQPLKGQID